MRAVKCIVAQEASVTLHQRITGSKYRAIPELCYANVCGSTPSRIAIEMSLQFQH